MHEPATSAGDTSGATPFSRSHRLLTIGALLTVVAGAFEVFGLTTVIPLTADDLDGLHLYGWVFSGYVLANLVGIIVGGDQCDRRGPGRPFGIGMTLFIAGLLVAGFAPTMEIVVAGRVLQGFGNGLYFTAIYVVVSRAYPPAAQARMLALMSSAWIVPGLVGPALSGWVGEAFGWRWVFWGVAPPLLLAVAIAWPQIRQVAPDPTATPQAGAGRLPTALALSVGAAALFYGLTPGPLPLVAAVALALAGGLVTVRAFGRLSPRGTLRAAPGLPAAIAVMGLINVGFIGVESFITLGLIDIRGLSPTAAGLVLTASALTWTAGSWVQAHWAEQRSRRRIVQTGCAIIAIGVAIEIVALWDQVPVAIAIAGWAIAGLGMGLAYSGCSLTVLQTADPGAEGAAAAAMNLSGSLGIGLAAGVGGALVAGMSIGDDASRSSLVVHYALMVAALLLAVLAAARLPHAIVRAVAADSPAPGN